MKNNKIFLLGIIFLFTMQSIQAQISLPNWLQNAINFYQAENTKTLTNNKFSKEEYYDLAYRKVMQIDSLSMLIPDSSVGVIDATGKYISEKDDNFGLCFDSGHNNVYTKDFKILDYANGKIFVVHLHDNNGFKDEHCTIGEGTINWKMLY